MLSAKALSLLLVLNAGAADTGGRTLWLFQPLYPGQDFIVARGEEALGRLMPGDARRGDIVGRKELTAYLDGKKADLSCLTGDIACTDPVDSFNANLGFDRVVLLRGGQEDNAYKFKVTSYQPTTGETAFAEGSGTSLDKALLAAMVKVVPLAAALTVTTEPPGATVLIDGEKVGTTPFEGQILPGQRTVKLDLLSHMPLEKRVDVSVRGTIAITEKLEKMPARLTVNAMPAETVITVDGKEFGKGKADKPIQPGSHKIHLEADGYLPLDETVDIAPGGTVTLDKALEPTTWTTVRQLMVESQEDIYSRKDYFQLSFEQAGLFGDLLATTANFTSASARQLLTKDQPLVGGSLEYGHNGRYFGVMIAGLAYYQTAPGDTWEYRTTDDSNPIQKGFVRAGVLRGLQPFLRVAVWKFTLSVQGGLEGRVLNIQSNVDSSQSGYFAFDPELALYAKLRFYVISGLFLEGGWRTQYNPFDDVSAPFRGFHGGMGFAF